MNAIQMNISHLKSRKGSLRKNKNQNRERQSQKIKLSILNHEYFLLLFPYLLHFASTAIIVLFDGTKRRRERTEL